MEINNCYRLLDVSERSTNDEITSAYKRLALKYHPDKNPGRSEWANEAMSRINTAYSEIMSYRFKKTTAENESIKPGPGKTKNDAAGKSEEKNQEIIDRFVKNREDAKDSLYRYFQYNLYNLHRRMETGNKRIFENIVKQLKRSYHSIELLSGLSMDPETKDHLTVFNKMIFDFYRASECLNILDSYSNQYDVDAYRIYKKGDEMLNDAQKEIFYDRHNRGFIKKTVAHANILNSARLFERTLQLYPESSWAVETQIKYEFAKSLNKYFELFFNE
ncbi:MAG: DnaJ domain-containing protein [Spirochaetes bacterium]|jgi:hypothetical protein|nr:DnaJ domain-containing protein [Spirochaetota bacterium]